MSRAVAGAPSGMHEPPRVPALLAAAAGGAFPLLVAALHVLEPGMEPSWHFLSEYALTGHGWMMTAAFLVLGAGYGSLAVALRPHLRGKVGALARLSMWVGAVALLMGAVFPMDPPGTAPELASTAGILHQVAGTLGMAMPLAAAAVAWRLAREPAWARARRSVVWATWAALLGFLVALVAMGWMLGKSGGALGPEVRIGWPNRLEVAGYCLWVAVVGLWAARVGGPAPESA